MPITKRQQPDRTEKEQAVPPMPPVLIRLGQYLLAVMLIIGPLAVLQPGKLLYNSLDSPRRLLLMLGAGLLAALIVRSWALRRRLVLRWHLLDGAVLLYFLLVAAGSIGGLYPRISFFGPLWLQDSLPLLVIGVCLYFGIKEFLRGREDLERFATLIGVTGGVVALVGLFDYFVTPHIGREFAFNANFLGWRLSSTLGNPMFTGTYFAMTLPMAAGAALATRSLNRRILLGSSVVLMLPALLLTQTRASWIGFALAVPFVLVLAVLEWRKTQSRHAAITVAIALVVLAGTLAVGLSNLQLRARLGSVVNMEDETIQTRRVYMTAALNIFAKYPIQGAGYGNIKAVFPQFRPSSAVRESGLPLNRGYSTAQPHNIILQTAAESGMMGLLPFLLIAVLIYRTGFLLLRGNPEQAWLTIGLLGSFTAYYITNLFSFDNTATLAQFWVLAGLLAGLAATERVLPSRYGGLAARLSRRVVSMFNVAALVIALGAGLAFLIQFSGAFTLQRAMDRMALAEVILAEATSHNPPDSPRVLKGCALYDKSIKDIEGIIATSLVPDNVMYEMLFMAYRGRHNNSLSEAEELELRKRLHQMGERGLKFYDRDPIILRYYILELLGKGASVKERERAAELASSLVDKFEPNSGEVHILLAQARESLGDYGRAMLAAEDAVKLDNTSADAHGLLGKLYFLVANSQPTSAARDRYMAMSIREYDEVPKYENAALFDPDRSRLAVALLYTDQPDRAVAEARKLQYKSLLDDICKETAAIYREKGKPEEGERLIREMRLQTPPPVPMLGPMPE